MKNVKNQPNAKEKAPTNIKAIIDINNYIEKINNIEKKQLLTESLYAQKAQQNKKEQLELLQTIKSLQEEKAAILQEKSHLLKREREEEEMRSKLKISNATHLSFIKEKSLKEEEEIISQLEGYSKELEKIELFIIQEPLMREELTLYEQQLKTLQEEEGKLEMNRVSEIDDMKYELKQEALIRLQAKNAELFLKKRTGFDEEVRLIIAQNHYYYSELEFQTQHKNMLVDKNVFLREQLVRLRKESEAHCQIEQELSKRRYFCSKITKELTAQSAKLQKEIDKRSKVIVHEPLSAPPVEPVIDVILPEKYAEVLKEYRQQHERKKALSKKLTLCSRFICAVLNHVKGLRKCFACPEVFDQLSSLIFINEATFEELSEEQQYHYFITIEKIFTDLYYLS